MQSEVGLGQGGKIAVVLCIWEMSSSAKHSKSRHVTDDDDNKNICIIRFSDNRDIVCEEDSSPSNKGVKCLV